MTTSLNPDSPSFASRRLRAIAAFDAKVKQEREQRYQRNVLTAVLEVTPEISSAVTSAAIGSRWGARAQATGASPIVSQDSVGAPGHESVLHLLKSGDEGQIKRACKLAVASTYDCSVRDGPVIPVPTTHPRGSDQPLRSHSSFVVAAVAAARAGFPGPALRVLDCLCCCGMDHSIGVGRSIGKDKGGREGSVDVESDSVSGDSAQREVLNALHIVLDASLHMVEVVVARNTIDVLLEQGFSPTPEALLQLLRLMSEGERCLVGSTTSSDGASVGADGNGTVGSGAVRMDADAALGLLDDCVRAGTSVQTHGALLVDSTVTCVARACADRAAGGDSAGVARLQHSCADVMTSLIDSFDGVRLTAFACATMLRSYANPAAASTLRSAMVWVQLYYRHDKRHKQMQGMTGEGNSKDANSEVGKPKDQDQNQSQLSDDDEYVDKDDLRVRQAFEQLGGAEVTKETFRKLVKSCRTPSTTKHGNSGMSAFIIDNTASESAQRRIRADVIKSKSLDSGGQKSKAGSTGHGRSRGGRGRGRGRGRGHSRGRGQGRGHGRGYGRGRGQGRGRNRRDDG